MVIFSITQILVSQLESELKLLLTTQVSECPGNGHVRAYPCVLTLLELTTNLREALWWCTQWTIQQQPIPPCPTSSATQNTQSGYILEVVWMIQGVPPEWFLYQREVGTYINFSVLYFNWLYCTSPAPPTPTEVTAQVINASSVRVTWQWTSSGSAPTCFNATFVTYHTEGGDESSIQLTDPAATEATFTNLQCLTNYTITVVATAGEHRREVAAFFLLQGMLSTCMEGCAICNTVVTWCLSLSTTQVHQMLQCPWCLPPQYIWHGCLPATHSNITSITVEHVGLILTRADSVRTSSSIPSMDSKKA